MYAKPSVNNRGFFLLSSDLFEELPGLDVSILKKMYDDHRTLLKNKMRKRQEKLTAIPGFA